jgi:hypothetical protein
MEAAASNASFGGAGTWSYAASDESTALVISADAADESSITGNGVLSSTDSTAKITVATKVNGGLAIGQSTTLDLSNGGQLVFADGDANVVTLAASGSGSDGMTDIGKLVLSSTKSIYGGNSGTSQISDKFVTGNDTGADLVTNIYVGGSDSILPSTASGVTKLVGDASENGNVLTSSSTIHAY